MLLFSILVWGKKYYRCFFNKNEFRLFTYCNAEATVASLARPDLLVQLNRYIVLTYSQGDEVIATGSEGCRLKDRVLNEHLGVSVTARDKKVMESGFLEAFAELLANAGDSSLVIEEDDMKKVEEIKRHHSCSV